MSEDRARLFVALELPSPARSALVEWRASVLPELTGERLLRAVPDSSLHVTLCFLGSQPVAAIGRIGDRCETAVERPEAGGAPLPLALGTAVWLPRRRPRVLAVSVVDGDGDGDGELAELHSRLAAALAGGGWYKPETRPFMAHVTVARVVRGARSAAGELPPPPACRFDAHEMTLFRSWPGAGGARYAPLRGIVLTTEPSSPPHQDEAEPDSGSETARSGQ